MVTSPRTKSSRVAITVKSVREVYPLVEAVTFDLWNTLLCDSNYRESRMDLLTEILHSEGFRRDRHAFGTAYSSMIEHSNEAWRKDRRHVPAAELTEFILARLGVHLKAELKSELVKGFEEAILSDPPPLMKDAEEVLKSVHKQLRIGLISNSGVTPGNILRKVLSDYGILRYFRCTVFSDEVGYHKPHPVIFQRAVEELRVKASEIVHIGDLLETDIAGAKTAGMKAVWFNTTGRQRPVDEARFRPDYEIGNLSEAIEILAK